MTSNDGKKRGALSSNDRKARRQTVKGGKRIGTDCCHMRIERRQVEGKGKTIIQGWKKKGQTVIQGQKKKGQTVIQRRKKKGQTVIQGWKEECSGLSPK